MLYLLGSRAIIIYPDEYQEKKTSKASLYSLLLCSDLLVFDVCRISTASDFLNISCFYQIY